MEYRLNKIDMELRDKINESTSEKKVHRTAAVQGINNRLDNKNNDKSKNNPSHGEEKEFTLKSKDLQNGKIVITAVKSKKYLLIWMLLEIIVIYQILAGGVF